MNSRVYPKALEVLDATLSRFASRTTSAVQYAVGRAKLERGTVLERTGDANAAIETFDEIVCQFGEGMESDHLELAIIAASFKARMLAAQVRHEAAIEAFEKALMLGKGLAQASKFATLSEVSVDLADLMIDSSSDLKRAEALLLDAVELEGDRALRNLVWVCLLDNRLSEADAHRASIEDGTSSFVQVLDAALELAHANLGLASERLAACLDALLPTTRFGMGSDMDRLLRLSVQLGHGEFFIEWFEGNGIADRAAPMVAAFKAYVLGSATLLDVNPEVRGPASSILKFLEGPRRNAEISNSSRRQKNSSRSRQKT